MNESGCEEGTYDDRAPVNPLVVPKAITECILEDEPDLERDGGEFEGTDQRRSNV